MRIEEVSVVARGIFRCNISVVSAAVADIVARGRIFRCKSISVVLADSHLLLNSTAR